MIRIRFSGQVNQFRDIFGRHDKGKGNGKDKFLVRPSCSPLENRRQWVNELKAETECDVFGRTFADKRHWAFDREHATSPSSLSPKTPDTCSSNDDTTTLLQPTGEGRNVFPRGQSRSKRTSAEGVNWTDVSETDSFYLFHRCRYQNGKCLRRLRRGQRRRAMVSRDRLQVRLGHKIQKWSVSWYAERSCFARLSDKGRVTD